jgi:hypothetical protein
MYEEDWILLIIAVICFVVFGFLLLPIGEDLGWWELGMIHDSNDMAPDGYEGSGY